jgi:hypothetical protein
MVVRGDAPRRHRNGPSTSLSRHMEATHGIGCGSARQIRPIVAELLIPTGAVVRVGSHDRPPATRRSEAPTSAMATSTTASACPPHRLWQTYKSRRIHAPAHGLRNLQGAASAVAHRTSTQSVTRALFRSRMRADRGGWGSNRVLDRMALVRPVLVAVVRG